MHQQAIIFTYDDYLALPNDGKRYEIIEGELYMTPTPQTDHQFILGNLYRILDAYIRKNKLGLVLLAPTDVVLSMTDIVQPDIVYVSKEREHIITKKNIIAAPDLVIEILSEATEKTDRTTKKELYERFGVKEYWIVETERKVIEVYQRKENLYASPVVYGTNDTLHSSLLAGFSILVSSAFEK